MGNLFSNPDENPIEELKTHLSNITKNMSATEKKAYHNHFVTESDKNIIKYIYDKCKMPLARFVFIDNFLDTPFTAIDMFGNKVDIQITTDSFMLHFKNIIELLKKEGFECSYRIVELSDSSHYAIHVTH